MHRTHQRRQQRVAYAASVRVHTSGRPHPFEARSINLSSSGVLVESLQPCAVGTEVICEIPLPGGRRQLRGRVARLEALSPAAVGLAIAFTGLDAPDQELLSEAIGQDDGRTRVVQVRFEGMREPMRSRAQLTPEGLRLTTALPFLRLRSPVEVTFLSGESNVRSKGMIQNVELDQFAEDGTPRLAVNVAFSAEPEVQPGDPVAVAPPPEPVPAAAPLPVPASAAPLPVRPAAAAPPVHAPPRADHTALIRVLSVAAMVAAAGLVVISVLQLRGQAPVATAPAPALPTTPPPAVAAERRPQVQAQARLPELPAAPAPTAIAVPPPAPPPVLIPPPLPPDTPGPSIESDGAETTASVPISGSTEGMVHYSLGSHRKGVVINLPLAHAEIPVGLHSIRHDGVRYVWIRNRAEGGISVRFLFESPPPDERLLEVTDDAVTVRVRLHGAAVAAE
jgi:hypothetical protein